MIKEKIKQAQAILREEEIDCWLTFVRESGTIPDPAMDLIVGTGVTWQSAFILTSKDEAIAIVGSLDKANQESYGYYETIIGYVQSIQDELLKILKRINPNKIALNFSIDSPVADGLTHGMFLQLESYLKNTPYLNRLTSSQPIINKLKGRKTASEIERVQEAIKITLRMFERAGTFIKSGRTEKEVAGFLLDLVEEGGFELAWDPEHCPAVFSGPDTAGAHAKPTERTVQPGHVLNIDFGIKYKEYCSDLQRSWYILRKGETEAPAEVRSAFRVIYDSISLAAEALKPGVTGFEIDSIARDYIVSQDFAEYPHALGHQIGRLAHDGGALLAPKWERYGNLPDIPIEKNQLFTLEPRLTIPGYGVATVEEIVLVTDSGCRFLSERQEEITLVQS
jgi:Xaa-Pro aminopeptidase